MDHDYLVKSYQKHLTTCDTLQSCVYHAMKDALLNRQLPDEITESQISLALNVSRTPVREAMHKLASDGLLDISHGRRARVRYITAQDITEIGTLLKGLHCMSAELCVQNATPEELLQVKEILDLTEYYTNRGDFSQIARCNTMFHLKICELGHNRWLYSTMQSLMEVSLIFRERVTARPGRAQECLKEHQQIYDLLVAKDVQAVKSLVDKHINAGFFVPSAILKVHEP